MRHLSLVAFAMICLSATLHAADNGSEPIPVVTAEGYMTAGGVHRDTAASRPPQRRSCSERRRCKGIGHIGFIQALEDNDIPIDYITGTSMGAIVGGLYASGFTPKEMLELIASKDSLTGAQAK